MTFPFSKNTILFIALSFLFCGMAFFTAFIGSLPGLIAVGLLGIVFLVSFFFPKEGILASVIAIVFFERYFTQQPIIWSETIIKLYPLDIVLIGAYLSVLARLVMNRFQGIIFSRPDIFLLAFFVLVTGIFLWTSAFSSFADMSVAFSTWKNYVFYGMIFFVFRSIFETESDRFRFGKVFVVSVSVAMIYILVGILRGEGLWSEFTPLSTSGIRIIAFPHALYFSLALLLLFLTTSLRENFFGRFRWLYTYAVPAVLALGIIGSLMRHLWVALACGGMIGWLLLPPSAKGRAIRIAGSILGSMAIIGMIGISILTLFPNSQATNNAFGAVSSFAERVVSLSSASIDESVAWRGSVWQSSLEEFSESPMFGVGLGENVPVELGEYRAIVDVRNIHNSWLALLVQTGIIGAVLFAGFLLFLARDLVVWRPIRDEEHLFKAFFLGVGTLYVVAFLFQPYLESNILATFFWMFSGMASACIREKR